MVGDIGCDGLTAALARADVADRVVTECGHFQVGPCESVVPGECEGTQTATKAAAGEEESVRRVRNSSSKRVAADQIEVTQGRMR